jgi:hypothetical protein
MAGQLFIDLTAFRRTSAEMRLSGEFLGGAAGEWYGLMRTLDAEAPKEHPWYLEDHLRPPFTIYESTGLARRTQALPQAAYGLRLSIE